MSYSQELEAQIARIQTAEDAYDFLQIVSGTTGRLAELQHSRADDLVSAIGGVIRGVPNITNSLSSDDLRKICLIVLAALEYE